MKSDKKDSVNFKIKDFRRHVAKKRSAIAAVALLFIPIFILTEFVTSGYSMDQKKSEPSNMTSNVITDYDANRYATVKIGNQIWMAENLKSLHYSDGTKIKEVYTYDADEKNISTYGRLYTWEAVVNKSGICPKGWHVPTDAEWKDLERYLGMAEEDIEDTGWRDTESEGVKLKKFESDFLWIKYSKRGVNISGFSAIPAGVRIPKGKFMGLNKYADFWTATEFDSEKAYNRSLVWMGFHPGKAKVYRDRSPKAWGFSIRCVK
jgi:uncharacterized protein (TIGR02145 family)